MVSLNTQTYDESIKTKESKDDLDILGKNTYSKENENEFKKWLDIEKDSIKKEQNDKISKLIWELNADPDKKVLDILQKEAVEPINWVNQIIPFKQLIEILESSTDNSEIKNSLKNGDYKDTRIYELPKYKELLEKWFILPSDKRNYYEKEKWKDVFHLWVDYQVKEWTEVKSIYDGKVLSIEQPGPNPSQSGMGHIITLEHTLEDWTVFYSLYWHLSWESLPKQWDIVKKWNKIAKVWKSFSMENWNWPSHLHFQIMKEKQSPRWYSSQEWEWQYDVLKSFNKNF